MQAMGEELQSAHTRNPAGDGPFPVLARLRVAVALALLALAALAGTAHAQQGVPPWPILFEGEVYAGGEPVVSGMLTLRVGDWQSKPVQVDHGVFRCAVACLVAGPPSRSYVGLPVTFHLDGERVASYTFDFPQMDTPDRRRIELVFPEAPGGGAPALVVVLAVGVGLLLAAGAGYAVRRRYRRSATGRGWPLA